MNAIAPLPETPVAIARDAIAPSPFQKPRVSARGNLEELATSIREVGIIEPPIVRPAPKGVHAKAITHELVAGHRRIAAAGLAGLEDVACIVREYTDDQVLEIQMVENSQRADIHPLDEADNFAELVKRGRTAGQIADKIGRDVVYVTKRLKLCQLSKGCRAAFDKDRLTLGAAVVLARVPEALQDEALKRLRHYGDTVTEATAKNVIEREFMLQLKDAPWPLEDAELVPAAGACTACPKRTGNQRELFNDVKSPDMCTDPKCHRSKLDAFWAIRSKAAQEAGQTVLEGPAAKKAVDEYGNTGAGFVRVDGDVYGKGYERVSVKSVVKKAGLPITLARDPKTGAHIELVRKADAEKAAGGGRERKSSSGKGSASSERQAQVTKERKRKRLIELALGLAVTAAEKSSKLEQLFDIILRGFLERALHDDQVAILARRGLEAEKRKGTYSVQRDHGAALTKLFNGMTPAQKRGLGVELALHMFAPSNWSPAKQGWGPILKSLGVDVDKVQKQVDAEERERAAAKKAKGAKKPSKKKAKRS